MLPDHVFEWIGRTVADRLDLLTAEHRAEIAEARAINAALRADNAELKDMVRVLLAELRSQVDLKLCELHPAPEISDEEFTRRLELACAPIETPVAKQAPINVTVPITFPKKGKEVMTVELDEAGRIKRSVKEEIDGEPDL